MGEQRAADRRVPNYFETGNAGTRFNLAVNIKRTCGEIKTYEVK